MKGQIKGEVIIQGTNTQESSVPQLAENVGIVFQDFEAQLFSTNVELEIAFGPENFAVPREEIAGRIEENRPTLAWKNSGIARPSHFQAGRSKSWLSLPCLPCSRPFW